MSFSSFSAGFFGGVGLCALASYISNGLKPADPWAIALLALATTTEVVAAMIEGRA